MKKIFIIFLLVFALFLTLPKSSFAAAATNSSPWISTPNSLDDAFKKGAPSLDVLVPFNTSNIMSQVAIITIGLPGTKSDGHVRTPTEREIGLAGRMNNLALAMTQKPGGTSTVEYLADVGHDLGIVPKEAYAQGTGFSSLSPILQIWKIIRDAVYLFYVVVFVVVGFMILLRKKLDPRTVITIEAALPKLVVSLILITFSYAIISLMVDISNLLTRVIAGLLFGQNKVLFTDPTGYARGMKELFQANIFQLARPIGDVWSIVDKIGEITTPSQLTTTPLAALIPLATALVFGISVLFITFKIFFSLLGPYVGIVLAVIFSPFELLMTALPGSESSFGNWLKNIFSKIAVFPVTFFLLCIAAAFGAYPPSGCYTGPGGCFDWQSGHSLQSTIKEIPLVMMPFGNWGPIVGNLIAFGILFTIPGINQLVQEALKVKDKSGDLAGQTIMKGLSKVPLMKGIAQ